MPAFAILLLFVSVFDADGKMGKGPVLENDFIQIKFADEANHWSIQSCSRIDGSDRIQLESEVFQILMLNGDRFTGDDYHTEKAPDLVDSNGIQSLKFCYKRKPSTIPSAPGEVIVTYVLDHDPCLHKEVLITLEDSGFIDRLQVLRFSTDASISRGGHGQAVFVDDWFVGLDYPGFHSWHANGFKEPDYLYRHPYNIDYQGRDLEDDPRPGLVTCFHFPGYAKEQERGKWGVQSKRGVIGLSRKKDMNAETALL